MTFNSEKRADAIRGIKRLSRCILSDVETSDSCSYLSYKDLTVALDPYDVCLFIPSDPNLLPDGFLGSVPIGELFEEDFASEDDVKEMLDEKFGSRTIARFAANSSTSTMRLRQLPTAPSRKSSRETAKKPSATLKPTSRSSRALAGAS